MDIKIIVGHKIKEFRLAKKYSQEKLAQLSGIDRTYIPGIEKGERNISIEVLEKISNALDVPIKTFFE